MGEEELHSLTARLREYFEARPEVRLAYLFGSRAEGTASEDSDYDIGVLPAKDADSGLRFELIHELGDCWIQEKWMWSCWTERRLNLHTAL